MAASKAMMVMTTSNSTSENPIRALGIVSVRINPVYISLSHFRLRQLKQWDHFHGNKASVMRERGTMVMDLQSLPPIGDGQGIP